MVQVDKDGAGRIQVSEYCPDVLPSALRYHPATNPKGARCDVYDHTVNAYGRDPKTGLRAAAARQRGRPVRPRGAECGSISKEQFLDLNERIGGFDNDGNVGHLANRGGSCRDSGGLPHRPADQRWRRAGEHADHRLSQLSRRSADGDVHVRYHSFSLRERLIKANGHADNHVMLVEDNRCRQLGQPRLPGSSRPDGSLADEAGGRHVQRSRDRQDPAREAGGPRRRLLDARRGAAEDRRKADARRLEPVRADLSRRRRSRARLRRASVASDIVKCQLKPIEAADYKVAFTPDEMARLKKIFPAGVCDWSKPGVEQQKLGGTWLRFGGRGTSSN